MRSRSAWLLPAVVAALIGDVAGAQTFTDDFETGNFSRWSGTALPVSGDELLSSLDAGHRGFGLRVVDSTPGAGSDAGNHVFRSHAASTSDAITRLWFRQSSAAVNGTYVLYEVRGNVPGGALGQLIVDTATRRLRIRTVDAAGTPTVQTAAASFTIGAWSLVEVELEAPGTTLGRLRMFINGAEEADIELVDWTGITRNQLALGEVSGTLGYAGVSDVDDFRCEDSEQMSTLALNTTVTTAMVGDCVPLTVRCLDSGGSTASAPYTFTPAVNSTLSGSFFLDAVCQTPGVAAISNGASMVSTFFRPSAPGTHLLQAAYVDFVSTPPLTLVVGASDAGTDGGSGSDAGFDGGVDAGFAMDAGSDAGAAGDGGSFVDAGVPSDAGDANDAAATTEVDGGSELRALHLDVGCGCRGTAGMLPLLLVVGGAWVIRRVRRLEALGITHRRFDERS